MPFTGYAVYRWLARYFPSPKGQTIAAGIGGWAGLTCAAFTAAVLLGIQPLLHTTGDGRALDAPYPLSVTVPVMVVSTCYSSASSRRCLPAWPSTTCSAPGPPGFSRLRTVPSR